MAAGSGDPGLERVDGIEPTIPLWKSGVLPLNYTRGESRQLRGLAERGSSLRSSREITYYLASFLPQIV